MIALLVAMSNGCGSATHSPAGPEEGHCTLVVRVDCRLDEQMPVERIAISLDGQQVALSESSDFDGETLPALEPGESRVLFEGPVAPGFVTLLVEVDIGAPGAPGGLATAELNLELPPRPLGLLVVLSPAQAGGVDVSMSRVPVSVLMGEVEACIEVDPAQPPPEAPAESPDDC